MKPSFFYKSFKYVFIVLTTALVIAFITLFLVEGIYSFEEQVTIICLSLGYKLNLFGKIKQEIYDNVKNQILNGTIVISDKKLCDSIIRTNKESYRELMKSVGLKINDLSYDIFYIDGVKVSDYLKKVSDLSSNTNKPNINDIYK